MGPRGHFLSDRVTASKNPLCHKSNENTGGENMSKSMFSKFRKLN